MNKIYPVILCGGSGTRLWPLSRKSYPKQFSDLLGEDSLFQKTVKRFQNDLFHPPSFLTHRDFRFITLEQLKDIDAEFSEIVIEPFGKNTGPAILAGAMAIAKKDPSGIMIVSPSDHIIEDVVGFQKALETAQKAAEDGSLITFGITPDRAETGYGYLKPSKDLMNGLASLEAFIEKPDQARADAFLSEGNYLWNAGIFMFRADSIIKAFEEYMPSLLAPVEAALDGAVTDLAFLRLNEAHWEKCDNISIDYAVMEKSSNINVVPFSGGWSDLGSWESVWQNANKSETGVSLNGNAMEIGCSDTLLRSENPGQEVVGIGLDNIVAIAMPDAVLVAAKDRAQDVKEAVKTLKSNSVKQAEQFPRDYRPWGWFESLAIGDRFQVKRIVVKPGAALSLQSHVHRAEHWVVVEGTAKVTIEDQVKLVGENQSVFIPLGAIHRLENPGKLPMILIEVQTGSYLGEDDIKRYEDIYSRDD